MFEVITALATPYKQGTIDVSSLAALVKRQVLGNVDGILACGTTGEEPLLSFAEVKTIVSVCKIVAPRVPLWVGVGGFDTKTVCKKAEFAKSLGADELLVAPPPFTKCTETGYEKHVKAISRAFGKKVWLYNCPSRCGYELPKSAVERSSRYAAGVKDAGDGSFGEVCKKFGLRVLCGSDERLIGGNETGVISVTSNIAPRLTRLAGENKADENQKAAFFELAKITMKEVNPVPIKYVLLKSGVFLTCEMRMPLTSANDQTRALADKWLQKYMPNGVEKW